MSVTLDTSHRERSPLNLFAPGTGLYFASWNAQLISVTYETSHHPIGPCGLSELSVDSFSTMAARSCAVDLGAHAVAGYYRGHAVAKVTMVFTIRIRVKFEVAVMVKHRDSSRST